MTAPQLILDIKITDEVFIATALLQRENPNRQDLTVDEIVSRVSAENLHGRLRPGVRTHVSQHCVANKEPNPGMHRVLYATGTGTRRLLRSTDDVHPARTGKIWPTPEEIPAKYHDLIDWARKQYGPGGDGGDRWLLWRSGVCSALRFLPPVAHPLLARAGPGLTRSHTEHGS